MEACDERIRPTVISTATNDYLSNFILKKEIKNFKFLNIYSLAYKYIYIDFPKVNEWSSERAKLSDSLFFPIFLTKWLIN